MNSLQKMSKIKLSSIFSYKNWLFWVAIAILIRLLVMPFTGHSDLFQTYAKSSLWAFEGEMFPSKFAVIWLAFHAFFLKIYSFFWPEISSIFVVDQVTAWASVPAMLENQHVLRLLFLLKLPYLLLELVTVKIFVSLFNSPKQKFLALVSWLFNPYMYYSLYVFGRNEILAVFFIMISILLLTNKKALLATLMLGVSVATRLYTIILAPIFIVLAAGKKTSSKILHILLLLFPLTASIVFRKIFASSSIDPLQTAPVSVTFFLPASLGVGHGQVIYLLLALLGFVSLILWFHSKKIVESIWPWSTTVLVASLSLMFFHPHYFAWLTPFLAWFVVTFRKSTGRVSFVLGLQFTGWLLTLLYWGNSTSIGLFSPLEPHFFPILPSPMILFGPISELVQPVNLGRSILVSVHAYMVYMLWPQLTASLTSVRSKSS